MIPLFEGQATLNNLLLFSSPDLEDLVKNEKTVDCNMDSSRNGLSGEDSSKKDKLVSKDDPAETSVPLEVIKKRNESLDDICCSGCKNTAATDRTQL